MVLICSGAPTSIHAYIGRFERRSGVVGKAGSTSSFMVSAFSSIYHQNMQANTMHILDGNMHKNKHVINLEKDIPHRGLGPPVLTPG